MSEALIFSFGSILFIITASATFSFGMKHFYEVQVDDMADAGRYPVTRPDGLTEIHVDADSPVIQTEAAIETTAEDAGS